MEKSIKKKSLIEAKKSSTKEYEVIKNYLDLKKGDSIRLDKKGADFYSTLKIIKNGN